MGRWGVSAYLFLGHFYACELSSFRRSDMIPYIHLYDNWPTSLNDTLTHSGWTLVFFVHHFDSKVGLMIILPVDMG